MKYITLFDTVADFEAAQATLDKPNVSLIEATLGINFLPVDPYNGHAYVEIGGVKWATKNVGASSITDSGLFFHWGDTQGYTAAQCINGDMSESYKYYNALNYLGTDEYYENYPDYSVNLLSSDDAATAIMGSKWRVPTPDELLSLGYNTNISFTTNYNNTNVPGYIFTDKTDNTKVLFLPAVVQFDGNYNSSSYPNFPYASDENGYYTLYWNNSQSDTNGYTQYYVYNDPGVSSDSEALYNQSIYYGLPIRAVAD